MNNASSCCLTAYPQPLYVEESKNFKEGKKETQKARKSEKKKAETHTHTHKYTHTHTYILQCGLWLYS